MDDEGDRKDPKDARSFTLTPQKITERQLIDSGGFIREVEARVQLDRLNDRVDAMLETLNRDTTRLEKAHEKLDGRLTSVVDNATANNAEIERVLTALQMSAARHDAQIQVLMDVKESSWTTKFLAVIANKEVRAALLLIGGWTASQLGPEVLKALLKLLD